MFAIAILFFCFGISSTLTNPASTRLEAEQKAFFDREARTRILNLAKTFRNLELYNKQAKKNNSSTRPMMARSCFFSPVQCMLTYSNDRMGTLVDLEGEATRIHGLNNRFRALNRSAKYYLLSGLRQKKK